MNHPISKTIGPLIQDNNFPNWWKSTAIEIPFFDNEKLPITFTEFEPENDKTFLEEADQALANFLQLNIEDRNSISDLAYQNGVVA